MVGLTLALALAWPWASPVAHAQEAGDVPEEPDEKPDEKPWFRGVSMERREAAHELFLEGNRLLHVPMFAQAADKYREALAIWKHPAFHYNLAIAQLNLVQPIEAHDSLTQAMRYGPEPLGDREYRQAEEYRQRLEQQLGRIEVVCDEAGAAVTLDGRHLFVGPGRWEGVVLPGGHQIVGRKPGRIPETRELVLAPGERAEVALVLRAPDQFETTRYLPAWVPWVGVGVGTVVVSAGGYLDWRSSRDLAAFDAVFNPQCPKGCQPREVPELAEQLDRAEGRKRAALGLYVAGGLLLAGGSTLVYINRERLVRREAPAVVSLTPVVGPEVVGITASGQF